MEEYIENGVRLGFLINPEKAVSYVYHHSGTVTEVKGYDTPLLGYDVMPDFELELSILKT